MPLVFARVIWARRATSCHPEHWLKMRTITPHNKNENDNNNGDNIDFKTRKKTAFFA